MQIYILLALISFFGTLYVLPHSLRKLQSNNYVDCNQHINTSKNLEEFSSRYDKFLDNKKMYIKSFLHYDRYMVIGVKK